MNGIRTALVVGAGPAGLTSALALRRAGVEVTVIERTPDWAAVGFAFTLQGPALRVLQRLGLLEAVLRAGHGGAGPMGRPPLLGPGFPVSVGIKRPVFNAVLAEAGDIRPRLGAGITAVDGTEVTLTDGSIDRYDLVIGADGLNSTVRRLAFPAALVLQRRVVSYGGSSRLR
ncbi:FAD-dependent oxidoreductase [Dactylosporangium sp. NPDC051541]|uniref:FAD-dependent oxidoreductase n=1 Tax=Dactylosporangium sp. NPDC051541 TaxID=3363977 RepID=UPI00379EBC6B